MFSVLWNNDISHGVLDFATEFDAVAVADFLTGLGFRAVIDIDF